LQGREINTTLKVIRSFFVNFGSKVYLFYLLVFLSSISESLGILMFLPLLNFVISGKSHFENQVDGSFIIEILNSFFVYFGIAFEEKNIIISIIIFFLLKGILSFIAFSVIAKISSNFQASTRSELFKGFMNSSYEEFIQKGSGKYANIINEQTTRALHCFTLSSQLTTMIISGLIYSALAMVVSWKFGLFAVTFALVILFLFRGLNKYLATLSSSYVHETSGLSNFIVQCFYAFKYIKATNQHGFLDKKISPTIKSIRKIQFHSGVAQALSISIREPFAIIFIAIILYIQIIYFDQNPAPIIITVALLYRSFNALISIQSKLQVFLEHLGSYKEVNYYLSRQREKIQKDIKFKDIEFKKDIELKSITFAYQGQNEPLINNLSLKIKKGSFIALIGKSGSGKTSLMDLLTQVITPIRGNILVDGKELNKENLPFWNKKFGYVTQNSSLFTGTIEENISLGVGADLHDYEERINTVIQEAHLEDLIKDSPNGISSFIGEAGFNISGGQRQRLLLARELYRRPEILILDEATSALDSQSELKIRKTLLNMKNKCTLIVIAHRFSTIQNADQIVILDKGSIVETGEFGKLAKQKNSRLSKFITSPELLNS